MYMLLPRVESDRCYDVKRYFRRQVLQLITNITPNYDNYYRERVIACRSDYFQARIAQRRTETLNLL